MATLSRFPPLLSFPSRNLAFLDQLQTQNHPHRPPRRDSAVVCACSIKKSRAGRKTKSNEELCKDIREFVKSVGLPEDHVPSTKELSQHGRIDLANIVRRRGHKLMRELLITNSTNTVESDCDLESTTLTGQDSEGGDVVKYHSLPNEVLIFENISPSSNTNNGFVSDECDLSPTVIASSSVQGELSNDLECNDEYESLSGNENVEKVVEDRSLKSEGTASEDYFSSSNVGSDDKCNDYSGEPTEFSKNLSVEKPENLLDCQSEVIGNGVEESFLSSDSLSGENHTIDSTVDEYLDIHDYDDKSLLLTIGSASKEEALYFSNEQVEKVDNNVDGVSLSAEMTIVEEQVPLLTTGSASKEEALYFSNELVEKVDNIVDGVSLSAEMTIVEEQSSDLNIDRALEHEESSYKLMKYSEELSLAEKVARFMQNGDLDTIDDNFVAVSSESGPGKSNVSFTAVNAEETKENSHIDACSEDTETRGFLMPSSNGSAIEFDRIVFSTTVDQLVRDDQPSTEAVNGQIDKVLSAERERNENQVEIDRLKFMLHQKELELSQLKEQLERDKLVLSALQSKAETEVSKAQKLILEKDTELLAAEESLSGLEEVHIHYRGEGEMLEVAGSFNGWHHKIKMDPQPSSDVVDSINSKNPRLWSTVLWLYPGVYEIKFVVDGHWKIDPHRESVSNGAISNNILRVGR